MLCSPSCVPIARLTAARAGITEKGDCKGKMDRTPYSFTSPRSRKPSVLAGVLFLRHKPHERLVECPHVLAPVWGALSRRGLARSDEPVRTDSDLQSQSRCLRYVRIGRHDTHSASSKVLTAERSALSHLRDTIQANVWCTVRSVSGTVEYLADTRRRGSGGDDGGAPMVALPALAKGST